MEKINICAKISSTSLEKQIINTCGIKDNNIIKYNEIEKEICIKILKEKIVLTRESEKEKIRLEFTKKNKSNSYIKLKDMDKRVLLDIITKEILINKNQLNINYIIDNEEYEYDISWEVLV